MRDVIHAMILCSSSSPRGPAARALKTSVKLFFLFFPSPCTFCRNIRGRRVIRSRRSQRAARDGAPVRAGRARDLERARGDLGQRVRDGRGDAPRCRARTRVGWMDASEETPIGACVARVARRRRRASHEPRARLRAPRRDPRARARRPDCRGPVREPGARSRRGGRAERRDARARRVPERCGAHPRRQRRARLRAARVPGRGRARRRVRGVRGHARRARPGDGRLRAQRRPGPGRGGGDAATRRPKPTRARRARGLRVARARSEGARAGALQERRFARRQALGSVRALPRGRGGRARDARPAARHRKRGGSRGRRRGRRAVDGRRFRRKRKRKRENAKTKKPRAASGGGRRLGVCGFRRASPRGRGDARVRGDQGLDARVRERLLAGGFRAEADARPARRAKRRFRKRVFSV